MKRAATWLLLAALTAVIGQAQAADEEPLDCKQVIQLARDKVRDALANEEMAKRYIVPRHWDAQAFQLQFDAQIAWSNAQLFLKIAVGAGCDTNPPIVEVLSALVDIHREALEREAAAYGTPRPWGTPTMVIPPLPGTPTPSAGR